MAANNITITLPNPYTPMAFVPPSLAMNMTHEIYAAVGSLAVLLWDILLHLPQDYSLAVKFGINLSFIIYLTARVTTLAHILGIVVILTAPVGNCDLAHHISILSPFSVSLSILPFLLRVSALYGNNKYVNTFFSTIWLFVVGCYIYAPVHTVGMKMGESQYCSITRTQLVNALTSSSLLIYDSLIFIATSWAFMRNSHSDVNVKNGIRVMVFGKHLPAFSKSILRDGQAYYLVILVLNVLFCGLVYVPKSPISACAIAFPFFVLLNNTSSHVYRNLRLGFYKDQSITSSIIDGALQGPNRPPHEILFMKPTSTRLGDRDLEAGDMTTPSTGSLKAQEEIKQRMEV